MADKTWLALTAGRTDIQVWLDDGKRYEIGKKSTAVFHVWLKENLDNVAFREDDSALDDEKTDFIDFEYKQGTPSFKKREPKQPLLTDGKWTLCLPKIENVVKAVNTYAQISGAVIYYTDRQSTDCIEQLNEKALSIKEEEPHAVGLVVAKYLEKFKLTLSDSDLLETGKVYLVNYLDNQCTFDGSGEEYPIKHIVASRLEKPLRLIAQNDPKAQLVLSDMGGQPPIKQLLRTSLTLHFPNNHQIWTQSEAGGRDHLVTPPKITHEMSLRTRAQCVELLKMGAIEEAYGLTREFRAHPKEQTWVAHVEKLHNLFAGTDRPSRQDDNLPDYLKNLTQLPVKFIPRCFIHAIRAEAALKSGNIINATAATYGITESARLDMLDAWLIKNNQPVIQDITQAFDPKANQFIDQQEGLDKLTENNKGIIKYQLGNQPEPGSYLTEELKQWCVKTDKSQLASAMSEYNQCLFVEKDVTISSMSYIKRLSPRKVRNQLTHGLPPQEIVDLLPTIFIGSGLWQGDDKKGYTILWPNSPASKILKCFGIDNAKALYNQLINSVCDVLKAYDPYIK